MIDLGVVNSARMTDGDLYEKNDSLGRFVKAAMGHPCTYNISLIDQLV